jgi:hypothetical protein
LKNTGRGAQFIRFGENSASLETSRDFESRTEYDSFKSLTSQSVTLTASNGANDSVSFVLPKAVHDTYEVGGLSSQTDLIRASVTYNGIMDATGNTWTVTVTTSENMT